MPVTCRTQGLQYCHVTVICDRCACLGLSEEAVPVDTAFFDPHYFKPLRDSGWILQAAQGHSLCPQCAIAVQHSNQ